jgi:hypothetical protein
MRKTFLSSLLLATALLLSTAAHAQKKKKNEPAKAAANSPATQGAGSSPKTIAGVTGKLKAYKGLFEMYMDEANGSVYMLIRQDQLDKEYIYHSHSVDGVASVGHNRGSFKGNKVFTIRKSFDKIEFVSINTSFYFDPNNALSRAAKANISDAVLVAEKIEAEDKAKGEYLIKMDKVFLSEDFHPIKPVYPPTYQGFKLGNLSKDKTKYISLNNYPKNSDIVVEYSFDNPAPTGGAGNDITDNRFVTVKFQHSLIEMPQNDFIPTFDDARVGYFTTQVNDMTSTEATNYRDLVHKWHLRKKDPNAALSEPIEPIVFWIENTTPLEFRDVIMKAGLAWNEAFEKAGFKNAIQIKIQPDTATWDAGDIRYNVLRWTSSPNPPFGGYGPSFVNPRTGQILGADIMLEYVFVTNRLRQEQIFAEAALYSEVWDESKAEELAKNMQHQYCSLGHHLHHASLLGGTVLKLMDAPEVEVKKYIEESLYYLVLHEMGHTLGLNHNMRASQLHSPEALNNKELVAKVGLIGSVMDYPMPHIALDRSRQSQYFTTKPGPYDLWAIEFAYGTLDNAEAESARLKKVLARSTEPALAFGNDADDMRSAGKAIDPRVMIDDLSSDMISYGAERIKMANSLIGKLKEKFVNQNPEKSYHELRSRYLVLTGYAGQAARAISRYIGGVYVDRAFIGQQGATQPFTPVSYADQKRAMKTLNDLVFSPNALKTPSDLYSFLQMQRRGFGFFSAGEDPKIHDRVLNIHRDILNHLLHPATLQRILDSELYGNQYKLPEMMSELTDAIFKEDMMGSVNSFRQNLQIEYVNRLVAAAGLTGPTSLAYPARSMALFQLNQIKRNLLVNKGNDTATRAHREHIVFAIDKAMKK